ncbi:hypothetical protein QBC38DRAFT_481553 [Podospora fimiseda]|uniref:Aminoglycoside phosphotransferase domain-containing protein n=1 Tax=Podospora fimiseda TaxID=252190 RepID=A0AAN7GWV2_9PEZI|nr:hypothetical protein QBC38DRAFT_481553 [Podospora fimiseda]
MYYGDDWPSMPDGTPYDGKNLLELVRSGKSLFDGVWDVKLLIQEIEEKLKTQITGIPAVHKGSNNYGFHITSTSRPDIVARLAQDDVNMPEFDSFPLEVQVREVHFEMAVYNLLRSEPAILASRLLYGPIPHDITGRRLLVFEKADGVSNVWEDLTANGKLHLLRQLANIHAALFRYDHPQDFAAQNLLERLFKFKPNSLSMPVAPTRKFWMYLLESKIKATIQNEGDMIGWEDDNETVGPIALAAKESLLRAIPYILPVDKATVPEESLYRLVLEHGDFGIHNTAIAVDDDGKPQVTSLFDWETSCIWPALLSDPLVAAGPVDLIVGEDGQPAVTRLPEGATQVDLDTYAAWARHYIQTVIRAGKDFRHLCFFGKLGEWAENLMQAHGVIGSSAH